MERPGIVDLRDLASRYAWHSLEIERFVGLASLVVGDARRHRFAPPRVVVVIAPYDREWMVARARPWLDDAEHVILVRDGARDEDPELADAAEQEWSEVLYGLSVEILDGLTAETARTAIEHAITACERLAPHDPEPEPALEPLDLPSSPWIPYTTGPHVARLPMLVERLERRARSVVVRIDEEKTAIDLGDAPPVIAFAPVASLTRTLETRQHRPGMTALGRDPAHPVGWNGDRMFFYWSYVGSRGTGFLSATDHDYPCGPAKKLYGYADNDPIQVVMAPDVSICAARFEHDVLLTTAIPIAWHRAGDVDVASFPRDPARAVFFAQTTEITTPRGEDTSDLLDEDARDEPPVLVIGPDPRARYAIDLTHTVHRITVGPVVAHVGGPDAGYAVFSADHALVRTGTGRLLGGWFRWATIEDDGAYWREDLGTAERTRLGPVDLSIAEDPDIESIARDAILQGRPDVALDLHRRHPSHAAGNEVDVIAIAGTKNVLLVTERYVRVI